MRKRTDLDLTEGPIFKKILLFALPLLLSKVMSHLYGMADIIMMGQFCGTAGMAAVSAGETPYGWIHGAIATTAVGVNVACATYLGAHDQQRLRECMLSAVPMGFFLGLLALAIGASLGIPLLRVTNVPDEIFFDSAVYYYIRFAVSPIGVCSSYCGNIFMAHGNTRLPMLIGLGSGLLNVLLNVVFIAWLRLGAAGAAIATALCQLLSFAVYLIVLLRPSGAYNMRLRSMKFKWQYAKQVLAVGIPSMLNTLIFSVSNMPLQAAVNSFGPTVVAGKAAASSLVSYVSLVQNTFADGALSATAQCHGGKKYRRISRIALVCSLGSVAVIAGVAAVLTVFARPLLQMYNPDPVAVDAGVPYLMFFIWGTLLYTITINLSACLKGMKKATQATLYTAFSVTIPRFLWVWLLVPHLETPFWLYAIYPISWAVSVIVVGIVFLHYRNKLYRSVESIAENA